MAPSPACTRGRVLGRRGPSLAVLGRRQSAERLAIAIDSIDSIDCHSRRSTRNPLTLTLSYEYGGEGTGARFPTYWHVPLVIGPDGRRLAKRHGDTRLASYREAGVPASAVLTDARGGGAASTTSTPEPRRAICSPAFDVARIPRGRVIVADREDIGLP